MKEPKTVEDWGEDIDHESSGKLGGWKFLPREIFSSKAYRELTLPAREVLNCYLNKLQYPNPKSGKNRESGRKKNVPENGSCLVVTNN